VAYSDFSLKQVKEQFGLGEQIVDLFGDVPFHYEYYPDTDMVYIELASGVSTESEEVASGIVLDFDEHNQVIGIEIEDASMSIDLSRHWLI